MNILNELWNLPELVKALEKTIERIVTRINFLQHSAEHSTDQLTQLVLMNIVSRFEGYTQKVSPYVIENCAIYYSIGSPDKLSKYKLNLEGIIKLSKVHPNSIPIYAILAESIPQNPEPYDYKTPYLQATEEGYNLMVSQSTVVSKI